MLDWDDLRFFLAVARHRTLAGAAKHLHVTQSTVSRRLASLQSSMGVRLLNRVTGGYLPTLAGESILSHVERIETEALCVERAVSGHDVRLEGMVRVSGPQLITSHLLAPSFAALYTTHPGILIEVSPEVSDDLFANREAEIVLRLGRFETQGLIARKLGEVSFALYACLAYLARSGLPDLVEGCPGHQLITLAEHHEPSIQTSWLAEHAGRARVTLRADSYETQHWAAYCGGGLALLPRFRSDQEPALRRVHSSVAVPAAEIWMGVHQEHRHVPRVRIVLDLIAEAVRSRIDVLTPTE